MYEEIVVFAVAFHLVGLVVTLIERWHAQILTRHNLRVTEELLKKYDGEVRGKKLEVVK